MEIQGDKEVLMRSMLAMALAISLMVAITSNAAPPEAATAAQQSTGWWYCFHHSTATNTNYYSLVFAGGGAENRDTYIRLFAEYLGKAFPNDPNIGQPTCPTFTTSEVASLRLADNWQQTSGGNNKQTNWKP